MPSFLNYTQVSLGIENQYNREFSATCQRDQIDDKLASSGRIDQNIFTWYNVDLNVMYQHHSCVLNGDAHTSDGVGINITIRFERK